MDGEVYRWAYGRIPTNGGGIGSRAIIAANTFMVDWKRYGLRSKTGRLSLDCGNDLLAALVPLIIDAGNTTDTNSNFVSADYTQATGFTGNGTNKCRSTNALGTSFGSTNSLHMGVYVRSKTTDTGVCMGCISSGNELSWLIGYSAGNVTTCAIYSEIGPPYYDDSASGVGYYVSSRVASNDVKGYKNGVQILSTATPSGSIPTPVVNIHCWNDATLGSQAFTSRIIAGYHMGSGFTATDAANAFKCWDAFSRTLSRNV